MGRLNGKVAFISGASTGIGKMSAQLFAREGAMVAIAARRRPEGQAAADEINASGGTAMYVQTDVTDPDSVESAVADVVRRFGKINILLNNAGGSTTADSKVTEGGLEEFWRVIKVDLFGTYVCCRFVIREIIRAGEGGSVINIASHAGVRGVPAHGYSSAKGGVLALTRSMAMSYLPNKIRVNAIAPGAVRTERIEQRMKSDPNSQRALNAQPLGIIEPFEVASLAVYLASDESKTTTGQTFLIDSGRTV